jgi:hypothetical protein
MTTRANLKILGAALCALALSSTPVLAADSEKSDAGPISIGGSLGFQSGNGLTQIRLAAEGQYALSKLAPKVEFDLAGHIGLLTGDSVTTFELIPAARVRYLVDPKLSVYGDGGLGIAFASFSAGNVSVSETWIAIRFDGGGQYNLTPNFAVFGELGFTVYSGTGSGTQFGLSAGGLYRF